MTIIQKVQKKTQQAVQQKNQQLRKRIKQQREALSIKQRNIAERKVSQQFSQLLPSLRSTKVATYLPFNGEISSTHIENRLPLAQFHLPRITHFRLGKMAFYPSHNPLQKNRYGITEPQMLGSPANLAVFDLIFVPLVAFDRNGSRLGMGAGFYDRALAFTKNTSRQSRPLIIGLAHHFQEVESLTPQSWDVPLDVILTDRELIKPYI